MTPIALVLNLLLGALMVVALALGMRLDRRLRNLRDSQAGFIKAVAELDLAAARTQAGLQQWRDAADEARELLHDRIEKAKLQAAALDALIARSGREPRAPEPRPVERREGRVTDLREPIVDRPRPPAAVEEAEARAEALAATMLNLAMSDREPAREPPARPTRLEPRQPARARAPLDDDLFDADPLDAAPPRRELASALGRRR